MSAPTQRESVDSEDAPGRKKTFPCIICQLHCDSGIKCNTCNMWSHHVCSGVPTHLGIMLVNTGMKYTCQPCARQSFSDYATQADEMEKCKRKELAMISRNRPQTSELLGTNTNAEDTAHYTQESQGSNDADFVNGDTAEDDEGNDPLGSWSCPEDMRLSLSQVAPPTTAPDQAEQQQQDTITPASASHREKEVPICRFYRMGVCKHGATGKDCKFRHPKPCQKLLAHGVKGEHGCKQGRKCSMFHPVMCRDSIRKYECLNESCIYQHIKGTRRRREAAAVAQAMTTDDRVVLELAKELRTDLAALARDMKTQSMLLKNLVKDTRASCVAPGQPTTSTPWISAITSR